MGTLTISYPPGTTKYTETRTSLPNITYDGGVKLSGLSGTKTINCKDKLMKTNLVIGGKTITCGGKVMSANVEATYIPSLNKVTTTSALQLPIAFSSYHKMGEILGNYAMFYMWDSTGLYLVTYDNSLTRQSATIEYTGAVTLLKYHRDVAVNSSYFMVTSPSATAPSLSINSSRTVSTFLAHEYLSAGTTGAYPVNTCTAGSGKYALFFGGSSKYGTTVVAYNTSRVVSLVKSSLQYNKSRNCGTQTFGKYGVVTGVSSGSAGYVGVVSYDDLLNEESRPTLSIPRYEYHKCASTNTHLLVAGGDINGSTSAERFTYCVEAYNTGFTKYTAPISDVHAALSNFTPASLQDYALFAGRTTTVSVYKDPSLTRSTLSLSAAKTNMISSTGSVGNCVIFAGGAVESSSSGVSSSIDVFGLS